MNMNFLPEQQCRVSLTFEQHLQRRSCTLRQILLWWGPHTDDRDPKCPLRHRRWSHVKFRPNIPRCNEIKVVNAMITYLDSGFSLLHQNKKGKYNFFDLQISATTVITCIASNWILFRNAFPILEAIRKKKKLISLVPTSCWMTSSHKCNSVPLPLSNCLSYIDCVIRFW